MSDPQIQAAFYLSPTLDALWRWSDDGEALTWSDGLTIAFRPEVEAVLARLAPGGLPQFGAVALLLAACRHTWMNSQGRETISNYVGVFGSMKSSALAGKGETNLRGSSDRVLLDTRNLLVGLDAINRLPTALREGTAAKALLAEMVFEGVSNRSSPEDALNVIRALDEGIHPDTLRPQLCQEESLSQFARQVAGLPPALARVDAEALARRAKTGLDAQPVQPQEDLAPPERVRRLLASLRDDKKLTGMARLAQDLMAAVSVPRTLKARDELPVGGFADITNRGPLDRLLVSELAHDDLTLSVRVAVNEALYLRRENPPEEPPHRRAILLDAGIRMWGVPRVFAAAAALAMAATNDPKAELMVFRAAGEDVTDADLTTRKGLDEHLAALQPRPQPGESLAAFFDALGDEENTDAILVTHTDVLTDPAFLAAVDPFRARGFYVATVDRTGEFRLLALTRAGSKLVRQATLSLETIFDAEAAHRPKKATPLVSGPSDSTLPAILFADPFPFRLPYCAEVPKSAVSVHGLVTATDDGRLLHWTDEKHGGRQVTALLPRGWVRLVVVDDADDCVYVVITRRREITADLLRVSLNGGPMERHVLELRSPDPLAVYLWQDTVYFVYPTLVRAFGVANGSQRGTLLLSSDTQWRRGRIFEKHGRFFAVSYDGSCLRIEPVPQKEPLITAFDRWGVDGPWGISREGRIVDPVWQTQLLPTPINRGAELLGISANGHRLSFRLGEENWLMDLRQPDSVISITGKHSEHLLGPQIFWSTRSSVVLRTHFRRIGVDQSGRLLLVGRTRMAFHLNPRGNLSVTGAGTEGAIRLTAHFNQASGRIRERFRLDLATWADGSTAWLDSRGLLHLKSSDRTIPELSLTLTNLPPAAWSSEGKVCGLPYFIGTAPVTPGEYFNNLIEQFVSRLR